MSSFESEHSQEKSPIVEFEVAKSDAEHATEYTPGFVEWIVDERTGSKVAAVTIGQLQAFAKLRTGESGVYKSDPVLGTKIGSKLLGNRDLAHLGLGDYMVQAGESEKGLVASRLPDLVSRLNADNHDEDKLDIRGVGPNFIQFLAEYCVAMTPDD